MCIKTYLSNPEAEIAKGMLQNSDIEAVISADDCGGMTSNLSFATGGIRLLVKEEEVQKAKEILSSLDDKNGQKELSDG